MAGCLIMIVLWESGRCVVSGRGSVVRSEVGVRLSGMFGMRRSGGSNVDDDFHDFIRMYNKLDTV
jgi:hypothetical protein